MPPSAGLPLPALSRSAFPYDLSGPAAPARAGKPARGDVFAYTDDALFAACGVRVAFTERSGGASGGPYESLNLKTGLGDDDACVAANRAAVCHSLGGRAGMPVITPNQVHGTHIVEVASSDAAAIAAAQDEADAGCDAILVPCDGVAGLLCFADCLPLVLVAPSGAFSVVHCGWKGTLAHLAAKAAEALVAHSGDNPSAINAYIGAYIHRECFEVEDAVAHDFADAFDPTVASFGDDEGKGHVDLGAAVLCDLLSAGLAAERIADIDVCTVCENDRFFSYRAQDGICGRHGTFAVRIVEEKGSCGAVS